jgi:hypothetical protein
MVAYARDASWKISRKNILTVRRWRTIFGVSIKTARASGIRGGEIK